jgi:hypothetical protein
MGLHLGRAAALSRATGRPADSILAEARLEADAFVEQHWTSITHLADLILKRAKREEDDSLTVACRTLDELLAELWA